MANEPIDEGNVLKLSIPDEELGVIRVLFDELHSRIERTITDPMRRAIVLQHLRTARTHYVVAMGKQP